MGDYFLVNGQNVWTSGAQFANWMVMLARTDPDAPRWLNRALNARQYTIAGGTSEIQHNIIGERVLGLPKG